MCSTTERISWAIVAAGVCLIAAVWFVIGEPSDRAGVDASEPEVADVQPASAVTSSSVSLLDASAPDDRPSSETAPSETLPAPDEAPVEGAGAAVLQSTATAPGLDMDYDLDATSPLTLQVVDEHGQPVQDAKVEIRGLRSTRNTGTWFGYRGEIPSALTGRDGRVALPYWTWVNQDGRTSAVDLSIEHPDFIAFRDSSFDLGTEIVELHRGPTVVVSAWIRSPGELEPDFEIRLDRNARLKSDAWVVEPDGRRSTNRIPPGEHLIWLEHESEEHGRRFSEIVPFVVADGTYEEMHLELLPPERLEGELSPSVPRPVIEGRVRVAIQRGVENDNTTIYRQFDTDVADDGTFAFEELPRGRGQLFASSRGWVSTQVSVGGSIRSGGWFRHERSYPSGSSSFQQPLVEVPSDPIVVSMQRTGSLEVTIHLANGAPVQGTWLGASPNLCFIDVGCGIVPWREWRVQTDEHGIARIDDLPPSADLWIAAGSADYQMRKSDRLNHVAVDILPGQVTQERILLEPVPK